ncbi:hypothetical protein D9Q98_008526 [Chlorella vulgaris]|uniref:Uncharacterized protein n=1 Tax=Chlorella vulgaris TaxID=3077 RepID=A0A9D4YU17_CHLVU|nr:hypothetical protein D9Q98_008526 [Chlorella vulgaris]
MTRLALPHLLLVAISMALAVNAGPLNVACEDKTSIAYCTECSKVGAKFTCFACHKSRAPVYNTAGAVTSCKATTAGLTCTAASGDPNCLRCDGIWCQECKRDYYFSAAYRCTSAAKLNAINKCRRLSGNLNCLACNPDNTCAKCRANNPPLKLVPLNAIYINAGYSSGTQCLSVAALNTQAKSITWNNAVLPPGCLEVDSEFKCSRCGDTQSLVGGVCKPLASGSKCSRALPYYQYCSRCSAPMYCRVCNGGRGLVNGRCALPCRLLYGIGCKNCDAKRCLVRDAVYANGRR